MTKIPLITHIETPLEQIRRWLKEGATIKATDPNGKVLEQSEAGVWIGGLTVVWPQDDKNETLE